MALLQTPTKTFSSVLIQNYLIIHAGQLIVSVPLCAFGCRDCSAVTGFVT